MAVRTLPAIPSAAAAAAAVAAAAAALAAATALTLTLPSPEAAASVMFLPHTEHTRDSLLPSFFQHALSLSHRACIQSRAAASYTLGCCVQRCLATDPGYNLHLTAAYDKLRRGQGCEISRRCRFLPAPPTRSSLFSLFQSRTNTRFL